MAHVRPPLLPTCNPLGPAAIPLNNISSPPHPSTEGNDTWRTQGYQDFSKWMASDDDLFVFRRFETLNARTILWMQYRISKLEQRLNDLHKDIKKSNGAMDKRKNSSFGWDENHLPERSNIMVELSVHLLQYNQFIEAFGRIRARPRAEDRQIDNVVARLAKGAINPEERVFIEKRGDLIAINSRSRPPLGRWIEAWPRLHLSGLFRAKPIEDVHVDSKTTVYSSNEKFERLTTRSIIVTGLIALLTPMWWLEFVSGSQARLGIITGFICAFIFIMSVATHNRPFEVVAATAAYAAVLMVFMQIGGPTGPGSPSLAANSASQG